MQATAPSPQLSLPLRPIAWVAVVYVLAWSLLPPLLSASLPLDVVESLSWGREWQWGYYKHPPLAPWVLELFFRAFGWVGPFLLSQLCIVGSLWLVWRMGCRLMSPDRALIGALMTLGVAYYTRPALEFNHNIAQVPIWAALGWCLLAALQDGRLRQWALLGAIAGLGLLTKYSVGALLAVMALYLVLTPARRVLLTPGPWLALAVMLLLFAPHLHWLRQSEWLPMAYAQSRAVTESASPRLAALAFLATQAVNHVPLIVIVLVALFTSRRQRRAAQAAQVDAAAGWRLHCRMPGYLLAVSLGACLLVTTAGLVTGLRLRDMWGVPMWVFSGLLVAAWLPAGGLAALQPRLLRGLAVWLVLISLLSGAFLAYGAAWRKRPARTDWPQAALAQQVQSTWQAQALPGPQCALDSVAGDYWLVGLVAAQLPGRPSVFINGDERFSPWITPQRLQAHGTLWLGLEGDLALPQQPMLAQLQAVPGMRVQQGQWQIDWPERRLGSPLVIHWRTYVPADCAPAS